MRDGQAYPSDKPSLVECGIGLAFTVSETPRGKGDARHDATTRVPDGAPVTRFDDTSASLGVVKKLLP